MIDTILQDIVLENLQTLTRYFKKQISNTSQKILNKNCCHHKNKLTKQITFSVVKLSPRRVLNDTQVASPMRNGRLSVIVDVIFVGSALKLFLGQLQAHKYLQLLNAYCLILSAMGNNSFSFLSCNLCTTTVKLKILV